MEPHYEVCNYLNFVHNIPLDHYLHPEPALREMIKSIPSRRWIFTNSDRPHAERVMVMLGIDDCFDGIVDIYALEHYCKPKLEAYHLALKLSGTSNTDSCAMLDDSARNLSSAKKMGFFTVLVGNNGTHSDVDRTLMNITELPSVVPEFWK